VFLFASFQAFFQSVPWPSASSAKKKRVNKTRLFSIQSFGGRKIRKTKKQKNKMAASEGVPPAKEKNAAEQKLVKRIRTKFKSGDLNRKSGRRRAGPDLKARFKRPHPYTPKFCSLNPKVGLSAEVARPGADFTKTPFLPKPFWINFQPQI
jgi:hypothetical protein